MTTCKLAAEFQYLGGKYYHYNTGAENFAERFVTEDHNMTNESCKLQQKKKNRRSQRLKFKPRLSTILLYKRETFLNILKSKTKAFFFHFISS